MGISKARGIAWAKRHLGRGGRVVVMTGDGELQEGQNWEALQAAAHQRVGRLLVVVDRNELQSDRTTEEILALESLEAKLRAFGAPRRRRATGTTTPRCATRSRRSGSPTTARPGVLVARTIKGKGVSFMEHPAALAEGGGTYRWHAGAPDDDDLRGRRGELEARTRTSASSALGLAPLVTRAGAAARDARARASRASPRAAPARHARRGHARDAASTSPPRTARRCSSSPRASRELVVLDADLASDCRVRAFELAEPDRFVENGIAEQDMVSMAAGMARHGLLPVVNSFASFLASRANEQIYNQASERTKVVYAMHYAGLIPAGPGKSHQSLRDASLLAAIPGVTVVHPSNAAETRALVAWAVSRRPESVAIRLAIGPSPRLIELPAGYRAAPGSRRHAPRGRRRGSSRYGPVMLHEALAAAELLEERGIEAAVVAMPWLNRVDAGLARGDVRRASRELLVVEDHAPVGALGDTLRRALADAARAAGASASPASRAGPPAARRRRRSATTGSTAPRSRSASRSRCRVAPARELATGLGRPRRPAHGADLLRLRDRRRGSPSALGGRLTARVLFSARGRATQWAARVPGGVPRAPRRRPLPGASRRRERVRRRVDRWLDERIGYYPLAIRLNLRHGFHRERMRPGTATSCSTRARVGPLPRAAADRARDAPLALLAAALRRERAPPPARGRAARGRPLEPPDAVGDAVHRARAAGSGLTSVGYVASWDHTVGKGVISNELDRYVVQNERMRDDLVRYHDVERERIVVTGWPQADVFHERRPRDGVRRAPPRLRARPGAAARPRDGEHADEHAVRGPLLRAARRLVARVGRATSGSRSSSGRTRATASGGSASPPRSTAPGAAVQEPSYTDLEVLATLLQHADCVVVERRDDPARRARQRPARRSVSSTTRAAPPGESWAAKSVIGEHYVDVDASGAFHEARSFDEVVGGDRAVPRAPGELADERRAVTATASSARSTATSAERVVEAILERHRANDAPLGSAALRRPRSAPGAPSGTRQTLLVDHWYSHAVGHVIEALRRCQGYHAATRTLRQRTRPERRLADRARHLRRPSSSDVFAVPYSSFGRPVGNPKAALRGVPRDWDYVVHHPAATDPGARALRGSAALLRRLARVTFAARSRVGVAGAAAARYVPHQQLRLALPESLERAARAGARAAVARSR